MRANRYECRASTVSLQGLNGKLQLTLVSLARSRSGTDPVTTPAAPTVRTKVLPPSLLENEKHDSKDSALADLY
jgi:hypothetical protein